MSTSTHRDSSKSDTVLKLLKKLVNLHTGVAQSPVKNLREVEKQRPGGLLGLARRLLMVWKVEVGGVGGEGGEGGV